MTTRYYGLARPQVLPATIKTYTNAGEISDEIQQQIPNKAAAILAEMFDRALAGEPLVIHDHEGHARAWSEGVAAVIAEIANWEGSEATGGEIHQAWYQGMIMQGREVSVPRRQWETLTEQDRALDIHIARVFLQQMAINVETEVRAARAMGDKPEKPLWIYRGIADDPYYSAAVRQRARDVAEGRAETISTGPTANLTPAQWQLLVNEARKERDGAETRYARLQEQRRADLQEWRDDNAANQQTINEQARELAKAKELAAVQDREIVKLNRELTDAKLNLAALGDAAVSSADPVELDEFDRFVTLARRHIGKSQTEFGAIAALASELSSVRMLGNNPAQRDADTVGMTARLAKIAAYAFDLHRLAGTPIEG